MPPDFGFHVTRHDGGARRGELTTAHGVVQTPAFMPVGTSGAVKAVTPRDLAELGCEMILANTYHLSLRPGDELIARRGGLHRFMGWDRPILTDSGGYQVFSLGLRRVVSEEGVRFRSHLDGSPHVLTPEAVVDIQARLGSDITMVLDECVGYPARRDAVEAAMARSVRWARRARERFVAPGSGDRSGVTVTNVRQAQFGIIQGGIEAPLRARSVEETVSLGFDGYAIGGLSVGEPPELMYRVVEQTAPLLPADRPRYLMGTGTPMDLVECVARGVDLFDCVLPTRNARNGQLFTRTGRLTVKNAQYAEDDRPPDEECSCYTCRHFSRAYLRHLFLANEVGASVLNTLHNLRFYLDTMEEIRQAIVFGTFDLLRQRFQRARSLQTLDP